MTANISRVLFKRKLSLLDWEKTPFMGFRRYGGTLEKQIFCANKDAKALANAYQQEIRWNFDGSLQGHYVDPDPLPKLEVLSEPGQ